MPKLTASDGERPMRQRVPAKRQDAKPAAKKGRPTIMPSQRVDHGTPRIVAEGIIYPVLGDPVDLDPCSNPESIIRAHRKVMLPEDGLAVPWKGNVFFNPPFGEDKEAGTSIEDWVRKAAVDNRQYGSEIIGLFPCYPGSEWFDVVVSTSRACFLWGPGLGTRRVKYRGNKNHAAFHSAIAYWGPNLPLFTRCALRYAHPWFPEYDLRLARSMIGDTRLPEGADDLLSIADGILTLARNDDLASALASLGGATLGDILAAGESVLLERLRKVSAYELGTALLYAARSNVRPWIEHRLPRDKPVEVNPRQLALTMAPPVPVGQLQTSLSVASVDERVLKLVQTGTRAGEPPSARELKKKLALSQGQMRGSLQRLRAQGKITKTGHTQGARYIANNPEEEGTQNGRTEKPTEDA